MLHSAELAHRLQNALYGYAEAHLLDLINPDDNQIVQRLRQDRAALVDTALSAADIDLHGVLLAPMCDAALAQMETAFDILRHDIRDALGHFRLDVEIPTEQLYNVPPDHLMHITL